MRLRAVVFDLDGTLVDSMGVMPHVYVDTIRALGGPAVSSGDVVAAWHVGPTSAVLEHFLGRPTVAADIDCYFRHFEAAVDAVRAFPGVVAMVDALGHARLRVGVFTSATGRAAAMMLEAAGLRIQSWAVVAGDDVSAAKPDPEGLRLACARLGVDPSSAAYVGDAAIDLRCADAAGALAIHARWGDASDTEALGPLAASHPSEVIELLERAP